MIDVSLVRKIALGNPNTEKLVKDIQSNWSDLEKLIQTRGIYSRWTRLGYQGTLQQCTREIFFQVLWSIGFIGLLPDTIQLQSDYKEWLKRLNIKFEFYKYTGSQRELPIEYYVIVVWINSLYYSNDLKVQ